MDAQSDRTITAAHKCHEWANDANFKKTLAKFAKFAEFALKKAPAGNLLGCGFQNVTEATPKGNFTEI